MAVGGWENAASPEKKWSLDSLRWANGGSQCSEGTDRSANKPSCSGNESGRACRVGEDVGAREGCGGGDVSRGGFPLVELAITVRGCSCPIAAAAVTIGRNSKGSYQAKHRVK